jgi:hypothetical protein
MGYSSRIIYGKFNRWATFVPHGTRTEWEPELFELLDWDVTVWAIRGGNGHPE